MLASRATAQIEVWVKHNQWYIPVGEGGACVKRSQWEREGLVSNVVSGTFQWEREGLVSSVVSGRGRGLCQV